MAVDLFPGITDYISSIPSKTNLLDQLKTNPRLLLGLMELCIEIAMDLGMRLELPAIQQAVS